MNLNGAAETSYGYLGYITCQLTVFHRHVAGIHTTVTSEFHLFKRVGICKTVATCRIGRLNSLLGNRTFCQTVDYAQYTANRNADQ